MKGLLARLLSSAPDAGPPGVGVFFGPSEAALARLRTDPVFAPMRASTRAAAERALAREFDLLGSGPFRPVDPDRPTPQGGPAPIDWHLDPVRGVRFPGAAPVARWAEATRALPRADIKYPWELARCQHFMALAQAWLLDGERRFADAIVEQIADFREANPPGFGPNWVCAMDVAIRAANWALALRLAPPPPGPAADRAREALIEQAAFVRDNLEDKYEVTSNHYLANLLGLSVVGAALADDPRGRAWRGFARAAIRKEMDVQVLPDGADFESSVPYHRLVCEMFAAAACQDRFEGAPDSGFEARLEAMFDYHASMLRPDGRMVQIGDADDGRLVVATWDARDPQDGRHLLGPARFLFPTRFADWPLRAEELWEAAWWGFDIGHAAPDAPAPPPPVARDFADAGHGVFRAGGDYLAISNGPVGTKGFGNHKHCDQLSFEFHLEGVALIADPGSFAYTGDPEARNAFRATAAHSTARVDGLEQNEFRPEWLFRMFAGAPPERAEFQATDELWRWRGAHAGYARLSDPVRHAREFRFVRRARALFVRDEFDAQEAHALAWRFALAPAVRVWSVNGACAFLAAGGRLFVLASLDGLAAEAGPGIGYSPSYGVRLPASRVDFADSLRRDGPRVRRFALAPAERAGDLHALAEDAA